MKSEEIIKSFKIIDELKVVIKKLVYPKLVKDIELNKDNLIIKVIDLQRGDMITEEKIIYNIDDLLLQCKDFIK